LQLGLHILLFGLHKIGWTAPLEYAQLDGLSAVVDKSRHLRVWRGDVVFASKQLSTKSLQCVLILNQSPDGSTRFVLLSQ